MKRLKGSKTNRAWFLYFVGIALSSYLPVFAVHAVASEPCPASTLRTIVVENDFITARGFDQYLEMLPPSFADEMEHLGANGHYMDMGAGDVVALERFLSDHPIDMWELNRNPGADFPQQQMDLLESAQRLNQRPNESKPRVTAVTFTMRREAPQNPKLRILKGRFVEDIPSEELGKADIVSDVFGPFAYTERLDQLIQKYIDVLNDKGSAYIWYGNRTINSGYLLDPSVRGFARRAPRPEWSGAFPLSVVQTKDGRKLSIFEWMRTLSGIDVRLEHRLLKQIERPGLPTGVVWASSIVLKPKPGERPRIPKLRLVRIEKGAPPLRVFEEIP